MRSSKELLRLQTKKTVATRESSNKNLGRSRAIFCDYAKNTQAEKSIRFEGEQHSLGFAQIEMNPCEILNYCLCLIC